MELNLQKFFDCRYINVFYRQTFSNDTVQSKAKALIHVLTRIVYGFSLLRDPLYFKPQRAMFSHVSTWRLIFVAEVSINNR